MRYEAISFIRETDTASPFTLPTARDCVILRLKITHPSSTSTSIIIGSINLALGEKVQKEMLRDNEKPAFVELIFSVEDPKIIEALRELDVEVEDGFFTCRFCNIFSPSSPRHDDICYFLLQFSYNLIFM